MILKNVTISVPLKNLSNFWRSLEIKLINGKIKLKLKQTNYCVLSAAGNDNENDNPDNSDFTNRDTKLFVLVVASSAKDNQKLSIFFNKSTANE